MTDQAAIDYSHEFFPKPDSHVIEKITDELADHFPWSRDDWKRFIHRVLIDKVLPHQMNSDDRLRYYLVVAEAISAGEFHHIPYINGRFPGSDYRRVFETISVGLDPKGKNEGMLDFTRRLLSQTFKDVTILTEGQERDPNNPVHLILTTRDGHEVQSGFRTLFNSSSGIQASEFPVIMQFPTRTRPEFISRSALAVVTEELDKSSNPKTTKTSMGAGLVEAFGVRKNLESAEELDISPIQNFPEAFMYALLFPTTRLFQFLNSLNLAHIAPENIFKRLLKGGWLIRETEPILPDLEEHIPISMLVTLQRGFSAYKFDHPDAARANLVRDFALHALAVRCELEKDNLKLEKVVSQAEILAFQKQD